MQQAAYGLLAEDQRRAYHLGIGRALLARDGDASERLFEIVGHLNQVEESIVDYAERVRLAALDLKAGRKARASAAVPLALDLFRAGLKLIDRVDTASRALFWSLSLEAAECEFIAGDELAADSRLDDVIANSNADAAIAEAFRIRIVHRENAARYAEAVAVGSRALAQFGFEIPERAEERQRVLAADLESIDAAIGERSIAELIELPLMEDPRARFVSKLIVTIWPSVFLTAEESLTELLSARLVRLSIELGNTEESALGYITHAITVNRRDSYARGARFGRLGMAVNERFVDHTLGAKVQHLFGSFLAAWCEPLSACGAHADEAHRRAVDTGDFTYAARAAFMHTWYRFFAGEPLERFQRHSLDALAFIESVRHEAIGRAERILLQWARALMGLTESPRSLSSADFDEAECERAFQQVPVFLGFLLLARAHLAYTFGEFREASSLTERAAVALRGTATTIWHDQLDFYRGLSLGAIGEAGPELDRLIEVMRTRSEACSHNFAHQYHLLRAERARALGDETGASAFYSAAIAAADTSGFLQARALTRERAAEFHSKKGLKLQAQAEWSAAKSLYESWNAAAKAAALTRERLPEATAASAPTRDFDAVSILKAAQAIAVEIEWERLLPKLIGILIENAGAERGVLIHRSDNTLTVVAEGSVAEHGRVIEPPLPLAEHADLPEQLIASVERSGEVLVISDAQAQPRSLACVPIVRQGMLTGIVYLENKLSSGVFSAERIEVIRLIASQAAISLENARLYQAMKEQVQKRAEAEAALKQALADVGALKDRLEAENVYLQEEIQLQHNFEEIVGNSGELIEALRAVEKVAATDSTVLVLGETGTGKELFARAIHSRSARRERPLVKVNCGAIPAGLVESELFGHVKGAFTGALRKRTGRFELAHGGTIFLDEIGELPLETQAKLLRVLQEQEFEPVGSSRTQRVDVRIIAATNRNLDEAVRQGCFRADLLYRLNVFPIHVPPLRRRREDIPLLASFFLTRLAKKLNKTLELFSQKDMELLGAYSWPGNVRELENVVERAAILAQGSVPALDAQFLASARGERKQPGSASDRPRPSSRTIEEVERDHILGVLETTSWVVEGAQGAAGILGLHPNTLRSRMKRLGIVREAK